MFQPRNFDELHAYEAAKRYSNRKHLANRANERRVSARARSSELSRRVGARVAERGARWAASRAAAGLVSVSTTCRTLNSPVFGSSDCITIDKHQARVTRLRKGLGIAAKQLHNQGPANQRIWMQTLTYAGTNASWRPEHISRYLDALRRWHYSRTGSNKVRYAWVAELQQRGVIHYHVIVWLAGGLTPPKPDTAWRRKGRCGVVTVEPAMWPHGMSNRLKSTAPVAYLMKYASKIESKNVGRFPHGARIHGAGGLDKTGRDIRRWVLWPSYVQANSSVGEPWKPCLGGGYQNQETGEIVISDWAPTGGGYTTFIRIGRGPRRIEPDGPFSWAPGVVL